MLYRPTQLEFLFEFFLIIIYRPNCTHGEYKLYISLLLPIALVSFIEVLLNVSVEYSSKKSKAI